MHPPVGHFPAFALVALATGALFVPAGAMAQPAPASDPQGIQQWTTPDGPLRRPLDVGPFAPAIAALTPQRMVVIGAAADNGSVDGIQRALTARAFTSAELTAWYVERIQRFDAGRLNSVIELDPRALESAMRRDSERAAGRTRGPLHGIPVLLKDNISTGGATHTTAGAAALADHRADRDAFLVTRLRAGGAIVLGKANLSEWANFMSTRSVSGYSARGGFTRNPYGRFDVSGSSSGSAVAVAASFSALSVGSETSGSIIAPSGANNIVGLKPTLGLVSRDRVIPIADELDTAGPMGRSVDDVARLLTVLAAKRDPMDPKSPGAAPLFGRDFSRDVHRSARGLRVGVPGASPTEVRHMRLRYRTTGIVFVATPFERLAEGGDTPPLLPVLTLGFKYGLNDYLRATHGTGAAASLPSVVRFNRRQPAARARFGDDLLRDAARARQTKAEYRTIAAKGRRIARRVIERVIRAQRLDAVVATGIPYPEAGFPAISVPLATGAGSPPASIVLSGPANSEPTLLRIAAAIERTEGPRRPPALDQLPPAPRAPRAAGER